MGRRSGAARGFSLLEALVASVVLAITVLAVGSAISAGRQQSIEGEKQILAAMAAQDLMSELRSVPYASLSNYNGLNQAPGAMATLDGRAYPDTYWLVGRAAVVENATVTYAPLGVVVHGKRIEVSVRDEARVLATVETFVPEPAP